MEFMLYWQTGNGFNGEDIKIQINVIKIWKWQF